MMMIAKMVGSYMLISFFAGLVLMCFEGGRHRIPFALVAWLYLPPLFLAIIGLVGGLLFLMWGGVLT